MEGSELYSIITGDCMYEKRYVSFNIHREYEVIYYYMVWYVIQYNVDSVVRSAIVNLTIDPLYE